ncbi:MAG: SDR family NAD(P)-dependent oxidoreductase, partial [Chryseotalea sp.]
MNLDLSGKRALVGGSTQGIGLAAAKELAALGASVTLLARNENSLQTALQSLPVSKQAKHDYLVADFSKINEVEAVVKKYAEKNTVHIIVNNTGGPPAGPVNSATTHAFIDAFQAHVLVNQLLMQTFLAGMKAEQYGRII